MRMQSMRWEIRILSLSPLSTSVPSPSMFLFSLQNPTGRSSEGHWGAMVLFRHHSVLIWAVKQSGRVKWVHSFCSSWKGGRAELAWRKQSDGGPDEESLEGWLHVFTSRKQQHCYSQILINYLTPANFVGGKCQKKKKKKAGRHLQFLFA